MYVGRRYTSRITLTEPVLYGCLHCDFTTDAVVTVVGSGTGRSAFMLDNDGAADRATDRAHADAREKLADTLRFAHCPKCHRNDEAGVRRTAVAHAFLSALWAVLVGTIVFGASTSLGTVSHYVATAATLLVVGGGSFAAYRRNWNNADERIVFGRLPRAVADREPRTPGRKLVPMSEQPVAGVARGSGDAVAPYRAQPAVRPIAVIQTAAPIAPVAVVASGDPSDKPSLLV